MNKIALSFFLSILLIFSTLFSQAQCHIDDWTALKALYDSTDGDNWTNRTDWDLLIANQLIPPNNCDLSTLYGVKTDAGRVSCIDLDGEVNCWHSYKDGNNLNGILPPELEKLNHLKHLSLANNKLNGSIPSELGNLNNLISYNLHNNQLTGSIPPEIGKLINLEFLALSNNKLDGSIPVELKSLTNLKEFYIKRNNLSGCYPDYLKQFCSIASNADVSNENQFDASWEDFCATQAGTCPPNCHIDDWTALKALYESTNGDKWTNRTGWDVLIANQLSPPDNCDLSTLYGITINDGRVTCIDMDGEDNCAWNASQDGNNLEGRIPTELIKLNKLAQLRLSHNKLNGNFPVALQNLEELFLLTLDRNQLSGEIPKEIENFENLQYLSLHQNLFSGNIPNEIGNLNQLVQIWLDNNEFTGTIPSSIVNLTNLKVLGLGNNLLGGNISPEIANLSNLTILDLYGNQFIGSIPPEFGNLINLTTLRIFDNQLTGSLPVELGNLTNLIFLDLRGNLITDNIPTELGNLSNLTFLDLHENQLTGNLPAELCNLSKLTYLSIYDNNLSNCYSDCFTGFCSQLDADIGNFEISEGNNFDVTWEEFCETDAGVCICEANEIEEEIVELPTNYSGDVQVKVTKSNDQYILKNEVATVYDYSTCSDYSNLEDCQLVAVCDNNLAANEALWAATKAHQYFSTFVDEEIPPINIVVNFEEDNDPNIIKYNPTSKTIFLGKGDSITRKVMTAPDIVGHEMTHHIISTIGLSDNYGELGALQESFADIFGEMIEAYCYEDRGVTTTNDWVFGSKAFIPNSESHIGIRSFKNPLQTGQPKIYKGENWSHEIDGCDFDDNCGIHTNNGVQNHWFYLLAEGSFENNDDTIGNIDGIGKEKAAKIAFENLKNISDPSNVATTYYQAMQRAIKIADSIYINDYDKAMQNRKAWQAVGLRDTIVNPITWKVANQLRNGDRIYKVDTIITPMSFDLIIDSLKKPLTADGLNINIQLPNAIRIESIKALSPLLNVEIEESILKKGEIIISINRQANQSAKRTKAPDILSGTPILRVGVCIVTIDLTGGDAQYKIDISGGTSSSSSSNNFAPFEPTNLQLGPNDGDLSGTSNSFLSIAIGLKQKTCRNLGWVDVDVLNGIPPFKYIIEGNGNFKEIIKQDCQHIFNGLDEGDYKLYIEDSGSENNIRKITKNITIWHRADLNGSECCPTNLIMPSGEFNGLFKGEETIELENGVIINEGELKNCNN